MPKPNEVSIIIPAYITKGPQIGWFIECLESVKDTGSEIIVVDDGSTINLNFLQKRFPFEWYRIASNSGSSKARNVGVAASSKEFIFPLDCDDLLSTDVYETFLSYWKGVPLYPDLFKFSDKKPQKIHRLLDFDCAHLQKHIGISSVSVLHTVEQHKFIGGWRENIKYLEDGEYNNRLMYIYCGERVPIPVTKYRQHPDQKTAINAGIHQEAFKEVLQISRSFNMAGCCGGKSRVKSAKVVSSMKPKKSTNVSTMPGEKGGLILVKYVTGKGKGKHYYKGNVTKFPYKVVFGQVLYADKKDVNEASYFELVHGTPAAAKKVEVIKKSPRVVATKRVPVEEVVETIDIPDIGTMRYKDVLAWLDTVEIDSSLAARILYIEKEGRNRKKIKAFLERRLK